MPVSCLGTSSTLRRQHDAEKYELSDAEKHDLIKLINENKPLPEKCRSILFEDKREVELVWNGKAAKSRRPYFRFRRSNISMNHAKRRPSGPLHHCREGHRHLR